MRRYHRCCLTACLTLLLVALPAMSDVRLPHVLGDNMVLQRDMPIPIWGWAAPGEKVTVKLSEHSANAVADAAGDWQVKLPALSAGGPHDLVVTGQNTLTLKNILVGEVWICSGQSNMEMGITQVLNAEQEVAAANYPEIRTFQVPHRPAGQPLPDVDAEWRVCTPDNIKIGIWGGFSATAYFFGRELHRELKVPVGLICTSWGGTRIEPWTPPCGFTHLPTLDSIQQEITAADAEYRAAVSAALGPIEAWVTAARAALRAEKPLPPTPAWPRHALAHEARPTGLYNGMVHALVPFALRGAIWYQGESNAAGGDGMLYFEKMKALVGGWRSVWGQGDFPFYYVQIAPFRYQKIQKAIAPTAIPEVWQAQAAALAIPNTGMVVTTDITDLDDIHPKNKQEVGRRLALWALAKTYGQSQLVYSGPLYKSMAVEGNKIRVSFDHVGGGLAARDDKPLTWFEIAGADQKFVKADARIDGETVIVSSDAVAAPVAVRFGWSMEAEPNLMNKEGLPASPFRTDQW